MVVARVHRLAHAQGDVVADRDGEQKITPRRVLPLGHGQGGRNHGGGGVQGGPLVHVVQLEDVRGDAIGERRAGRRRAVSGEDAGVVRSPEQPNDVARHDRWRLEGAGERRAEPVEHGARGRVAHLRRKGVESGPCREIGEGAGDGGCGQLKSSSVERAANLRLSDERGGPEGPPLTVRRATRLQPERRAGVEASLAVERIGSGLRGSS